MKRITLVRFLSILAVLLAIAIVLVLLGAENCTRGDGCLLFSVLFVGAYFVGALLVVASAITWAVNRQTIGTPKYFLFSNLALLVLLVAAAGGAIYSVR